ncbi:MULTISPECIES: endonuclease [unclassified Tenacibaculum]|uniref:endonuclease n=1 Tax=unclassified Tenacibaculum TaxID=2635139 RepID=UPI001F2C1031|nr:MULTISPECIES: endonuclease [unclassified Tenacibaculum]MCF2874889.1 endonuclease [Tenacibaculum sp. Cn5-1]MCF2934045.1 endonuclease [Tenacibaculum sp. Cn5-34]MCG7510255.1 endonuclease [Tenacibaculum sp. Cn5-46]
MKRILMLGVITLLYINCGGNDSEVVTPTPDDKVTAVNDSYQGEENTAKIISDFLSNDTYKQGNVKITVEPNSLKNGAITQSGTSFTYTPAKDFVGNDSFKYTICSTITTSSCSTATITVTVKASSNNSNNSGNFNIPSSLTSYYNDVNFNLTGSALKDALATKTISAHTNPVSSYTPGVWDVLKQSDLDPADNSKVLLIYGYDDSDGNTVTDRTRSKDSNGGTAGSDWNREHVYAKSLGTPKFENNDVAGSDPHHLRASDVTMNSNRNNKKFADGSGTAGDVSGNWYPGDEWKGDVARMMMYMYLRYGNQCLPKNVAVGNVNSSDSNMIDLLLQWNIDDPVSDFEKTRNNVIASKQGNRNPLIDNPYLATVIWGGGDAENTWK